MADDTFKLPQASYEALCRIVQAYAHVGEKTNLASVASILGTDPGQVSRNTGFLVSVGLLEGGRDKGPTTSGMRLARALEFGESDDISTVWREVLNVQTLIQRTIAAIRVRGGMDANTLQTQIVYTAGADKTPRSMAGGAAVVEMMKVANMIAERDGQLIAINLGDTGTSAVHLDDESPSTPAHVPVIQRIIEATSPAGVAVSVELVVTVTATPDQLPALGDQVRQMLERLDSAQMATSERDSPGDELS